ncbi:C39 family peptidase [Methanosarcina barkeri]|uniref:Peptidase C39-like domain-containing protein n=3 Tax=Methanosarcina barkeri TaxID=2208 RepID=A0A0E3QYD6_METBA|nr:C39 family peptidase [Methanosarcina barkeri]AKB56733.1 hypothetical protein MSBR2_0217 [Methanosarcina barkeri 227]
MKTRRLANTSKLILNVLLLGIFITSLSSVAFAETDTSPTSTDEQTSTPLSIDEAKEIAAFYLVELSGTIPELEEWEDAVVEPDITFYDLEGNITAYSFDVMKNNEYDGFILISATKNKYPILEFSKGKLQNKISTMTKKSQNAAVNYAKKNKLNVVESVPIYEGATFYYSQYNLQDSKDGNKKKVIVDLVTSNIINAEEENTSASMNKVETAKSDEIKKAWDDLENRMIEKSADVETVSSRASTIKIMTTVPFETVYIGCSPTASAMVLEYWDAHGYPNFPSGHTLIQELATAMVTDPITGSTYHSHIAGGIETVCQNYQYTNFDAVYNSDLSMSEAVTEINANRPFILGMTNGGVGSGYPSTSPYGNHSVTCMGYSDGTTTDYLFIHDTWDGVNTHSITFGSWDSARSTWVRP